MTRTRRIVIGLTALAFGYCAFEMLRPGNTLDFTHRVFGLAVDLDEDVEFHTPRSMHGDGYSFERFPVPQEIVSRFRDYPQQMDSLPVFPKFREAWFCQTWKPTPYPPPDSTAVLLALAEAPAEAKAEALQTLRSPGNWYSICRSSQNPHAFHMDVDLYLLDVERSTFVFANFQM